jgi:copper(I)-binding protein
MQRLWFSLLLGMALALTACAPAPAATQGSGIEISDAWVRASGGMAGMGSTSAAYMIVSNTGGVDDALLAADSDAAHMVQIHLSEVDAAGVSSMHQVDRIEVPAGGTVELKPGSYHVMLMGLKEELQAGQTVTLRLTFEHAGMVTVEAPVEMP